MKLLRTFVRRKETLYGMLAAVMFQLIFVIVWLSAYDGVSERTEQFAIGIANEDPLLGNQITTELEGTIPFYVTSFSSLTSGEQALEQKEINMLIHVQEDFSLSLEQSGELNVSYYIDQGTPAMTKQTMEQAAVKLHEQLKTVIEKNMTDEFAETASTFAQNGIIEGTMVTEIVAFVHELSNVLQNDATILKVNERDGFLYTMIPLLIVLASYIGAMLVSQQLQLAETSFQDHYNPISLFAVRQLINLFVSLTISLLTVVLMSVFHVEMNAPFFVLWGVQATLMFSFLALSQIFVMLLGNSGMVFNIVFTAIQLVSSGAIVPRELLSLFYEKIGIVFPATYGVNSYFTLIYGGENVISNINGLLLLSGIFLILALCSQLIRYYVIRRVAIRSAAA
ncbi:MAG TPA: ABC transporter permease [Pseudogracilibacillus sp.]|nr:ABC transporter permease [Pseudogracilibacillus sp.]